MPKVMIIGLYFFGLSATEYLSDARHEVSNLIYSARLTFAGPAVPLPFISGKIGWLAIFKIF